MRVSIAMKKNDLPVRLPGIFSFNGPVQFDQCVKVSVLIDTLWRKIVLKRNAFVIPENIRRLAITLPIDGWVLNFRRVFSPFPFHCKDACFISGVQ